MLLFFMKLLIKCFFIFFILFSCINRNADIIYIRGKIYDPNQKLIVSDAAVRLEAKGVHANIYSSEYKQIAQTLSDNFGAFSFEENNNKYSSFRIKINKNDYFTLESEFSATIFDLDDTYDKIYYLLPIGYLHIHLYNSFPTDSTDKVVFYFEGENPNCVSCCSTTPITGLGPFFDTTFKCKWYGGTKVQFYRLISKFNSTYILVDTLFVPAFDTAFYELPY